MTNAFSKLPGGNIEDEPCVLVRTIAAIQSTVCPANAKTKQLGVVVRLPFGAKLTLLGKGFSSRTVKVRCQQAVYFIFLEDLDDDTQDAWTAAMPPVSSTP